MATTITTSVDAPPLLSSSLSFRVPPPKRSILMNISYTIPITVDIMPTKMMLVIRSRVSRLRMCVSSWAMTPASSSSLRMRRRPVVTVTVYESRSIPEAKAFSCGSSMMFSLGISIPHDIVRFSTILYTRGFSLRVRGRAPVAALTMAVFAL